MIAMLRLLAGAGAITLAGCILELARPGWVGELATDLRALPTIRSDLYEELELGGELEIQISALRSRVVAKQRILRDLIDKRLTLIEAATGYRDLDSGLEGDQPGRLRGAWSGRSLIERYCQQLIQTSEWELLEQPRRAAAVVARLKSELKEAEEAGAFYSAE